ncbi:unnamed protein product, partial [Trichogramma brassicae]
MLAIAHWYAPPLPADTPSTPAAEAIGISVSVISGQVTGAAVHIQGVVLPGSILWFELLRLG